MSIYNWPQSEWLKRGDRPPEARITALCFSWSHRVKASVTAHRSGTHTQHFAQWARRPGEAQRGKGLPEATQQENELILDGQRHREVGKGWSGPGKEPRQSLKGQSQSLKGSFRAF